MRKRTSVLGALLFCLCFGIVAVHGQLRVVTYNTCGDARSGIDTIFSAIGTQNVNGIAKPLDIICLQEQDTVGTTTQDIVNELNSLYGSGIYQRGSLNGATTGAGRPGIAYNGQVVTLLNEVAVNSTSSSGAARATIRYTFSLNGYDDPSVIFYIYNSHFKAVQGDADRRAVEAAQIRANADALGNGQYIIYCGDLNLYNSSEAAWSNFTSYGNGQAHDPANKVGYWHNNSSYKIVHSQSPVASANYAGQVTGGMDDRFDFQLVTGELIDGQGLNYISNSYRVFGNNGSHSLNGDISTGSGASSSVLNALENVSDHLPVVADYQIPAVMLVSVDVPSAVIVGAAAPLTLQVENTAQVVDPDGADVLDYTVTVSGDATGGGSGSIAALDGPDSFDIFLDSTNIGSTHYASFNVNADGSQTQNASWNSGTFNYTVVDHSQASFNAASDVDSLTLDFGSITVNTGGGTVSLPFSIHNLESTSDATADLQIIQALGTGDTAVLTTDIAPQLIESNQSQTFNAQLDTDTIGLYSAQYVIAIADDQDIPGATAGTPLTLNLTAYVSPLDPCQPVCEPTMETDFNLDCYVNLIDFASLAATWLDTNLGQVPSDTPLYSWEDGNVSLSQAGSITATNDTAAAYHGDRSLKIVSGGGGNPPQAFVAWVKGLQDGDEVTGSFYARSLPGQDGVRLFAHYSYSNYISSYLGDAGGTAALSGSDWTQLQHQWTFDATPFSGFTPDGLIIEARTSTSSGDGGWVDYIIIQAPEHANVTLPGDWETVQGCVNSTITTDLNDDCVVNVVDLSIFASQWLECDLMPASACWNE